MVNTKHKNERIHINAIEINAYLASSYSFKYYFTNWKINFIRFILKIFLFFIMMPIHLILYLLQTIFLVICLLINFIPFIRLFFEAFYIIIYDAVAISAMFLNLYNSNDYTNKLNEYDKKHII